MFDFHLNLILRKYVKKTVIVHRYLMNPFREDELSGEKPSQKSGSFDGGESELRCKTLKLRAFTEGSCHQLESVLCRGF